MVSEVWLLIIKKCSAHSPWTSIQAWKEKTNGTLLSTTSSDWGCLSRFLKKGSSRAVERCGFADVGFIHDHDDVPPYLFLTDFILVISWFLLFEDSLTACLRKNKYVDVNQQHGLQVTLRLSSLRIFKVHCLCCRSQWRPGLATANTE
jgi:hypothetical protein